MRLIADFHIHSKFSRACSKDLDLANIAVWCEKKGIDIVATADFTHPKWFAGMKEELAPIEDESGLYKLKNNSKTRFICSTEFSNIYSRGGAIRRIHHVVFAPSFTAVEKIITALDGRGAKLASDGRPILGIDSEELLKILLDADPRCFLVPAHAWTPWFAIFGSKSGFDAIEECFGSLSSEITTIETGLSSDAVMNWRLSKLDKISLISNSDAHSLKKMGREANVFEGNKLSYDDLIGAMKKLAKPETETRLKLVDTLEFFPEEGKYHIDGHRECEVSMDPGETKKAGGICPKCKRPLTVGVMNRVSELADRGIGKQPEGAAGYKYVVPLEEIIAGALNFGAQSKRVQAEYERIVAHSKEFEVLLYQSFDELETFIPERIIQGIKNVRERRVKITPGYDGVYGIVDMFGEEGKEEKQASLFDIEKS